MHRIAIDPWFLGKARLARDGRLNAYDTLNPAATALVPSSPSVTFSPSMT